MCYVPHATVVSGHRAAHHSQHRCFAMNGNVIILRHKQEAFRANQASEELPVVDVSETPASTMVAFEVGGLVQRLYRLRLVFQTERKTQHKSGVRGFEFGVTLQASIQRILFNADFPAQRWMLIQAQVRELAAL